MNVYGTPNLVADSDLSVEGFKDQNGNLVSNNQRSQLMLVASKPSEEESAEMIDKATESLGVDSSAVMQSSTFEIDLLLCGCVQTIPDGSYMQVAFGFPEGYSAKDAGTTFKVFHYKSDGTVEEMPCVVTEYGIIATVSSFSPYAIVALDSSKLEAANTPKSIYARTVGLGGEVSVTKNNIADHGIVLVASGDTVTYTFNANANYTPERIVVNGEQILLNGATSKTFTYSELDNNTIVEVYFVADSVAQKEAENEITPVYPSVKANLRVESPVSTADDGGNNGAMQGWLLAVIAVCAVLVVAAAVTGFVVILRKHSNKNDLKD
jgi:hypothetical protein